ncbi:uncharacterized protein [Nicotiana sylvestris]|uniref:Uncharacterized protein n=1 Tax=Nicotiana tabacum TaxID=4097 RepID=A0A1S4BSL8_TOBAC|nr:PREDICTED: uncharacterized protein LOC107811447 [Nicotiana tabacum]
MGRSMVQKLPGVLELDVVSALSTQVSTLTNQVNQMTTIINNQQAQPVQQVQIFCEVCGEGHMSNLCPVNPESIYFVGNQNQYWPQAPQQQSRPPQAEQQANLEEMMKKLMADQQALNQKLIADQQTFNQIIMVDQQAQAAALRNLEHHVGQLASAQNTRPVGALPSDTEPNPKAQVNAVTLRNGRALEEVPKKKKNTAHPEGELVPKPVEGNEKDDKGPEPEVPKYARYLRDIVENKRKHVEFKTVALTEKCSARVQSKLPRKLKDPRSFTIPLSLGKQEVGRALCDLGASINLMSSSLFKKLGLGVLRPTTITLQLVDRSLVILEGINEDVLVRVGKFILPADFIILDYEADEEVSIILVQPFLATGGTIIDGIENSQYVNYSDPDGTTELEEVMFLAERVKMIEKRAGDERGDLPRACKKARLHGRKKKRKCPA